MIIGIIVQKYFCNNLGVYALSYCAIREIIGFCKDIGASIQIRIYTEQHQKVRETVKKEFEYDNIRTYPIIEIKNPRSYFDYYNSISQCDIVFDTGLGDGFSDIYSDGKYLLQYFLKRIPEWGGCKMVLLPQTIGPYHKRIFEITAGTIIKKSKLCFVRDNASYEYAKKISRGKEDKVILTTDMAMMLPYSPEQYQIPDGINIGLNISGLLYMGGYTKSNQFHLKYDYSCFVDRLIEQLITKKLSIHLISHVYRNNGEGDEFASNVLSQKYKELIVAPEFSSPLEAKAYIRQMDFFIGSRMHSTIAAISSGVPVCPVGYSRKFNGLFDTIGYKNYVDATKEDMETSISKIEHMIDNREVVKQEVLTTIKKTENLWMRFHEEMNDLLYEALNKESQK